MRPRSDYSEAQRLVYRLVPRPAAWRAAPLPAMARLIRAPRPIAHRWASSGDLHGRPVWAGFGRLALGAQYRRHQLRHSIHGGSFVLLIRNLCAGVELSHQLAVGRLAHEAAEWLPGRDAHADGVRSKTPDRGEYESIMLRTTAQCRAGLATKGRRECGPCFLHKRPPRAAAPNLRSPRCTRSL
jgi:hypothetical protein